MEQAISMMTMPNNYLLNFLLAIQAPGNGYHCLLAKRFVAEVSSVTAN